MMSQFNLIAGAQCPVQRSQVLERYRQQVELRLGPVPDQAMSHQTRR
jgi:hypothetical protein